MHTNVGGLFCPGPSGVLNIDGHEGWPTAEFFPEPGPAAADSQRIIFAACCDFSVHKA